ncbi:unnamed protein product [Rhodiola kirilowii]
MTVVKAAEESAVGRRSARSEKDEQAQAQVGYAKRALVGAGARMLFYPTLLYNVIRNKVEPHQFRWWDQIDQYILLGAVPFPKDVVKLKKLGVSGVITLNEPFETLVPSTMYKKHEMEHLVIPTRDYLFSPSMADISRAVEFIDKHASLKQTTYVHCKAGRGRSTTVVLCYLIEHKQMTPIAALEYVRSIRPRVALTPAQWKAVQEYKRPQSSLSDTVTITKADLEGYDEENTGIQLTRISITASASLIISNLLASLKFPCGAPPKKSDACEG